MRFLKEQASSMMRGMRIKMGRWEIHPREVPLRSKVVLCRKRDLTPGAQPASRLSILLHLWMRMKRILGWLSTTGRKTS